jgi:hypothetical protein
MNWKCPHCQTPIGLFSPEMSALGKSKTCPHCGKGVTVGIRHGRFAIGFLAVAAVSILLGLSSPLAAGIAGGVGAAFGLGLKPTTA